MTAAKSHTVFVCNSCGAEYAKWQGKCHGCGAWETIVEFRVPKDKAAGGPGRRGSAAAVVSLAESAPSALERIPSPFAQIDRVLGGGVVPGALVLVGGDPGIGKSTLLLQLTAQWADRGLKTLYVSGEESAEQVVLRGLRLGIGKSPLLFLAETSVEAVLAKFDETGPRIAVIDSIQTMMAPQAAGAPGSVTQVRECTALLLRYAKEHATALFLVGHVTKDGAIAGPRLLEHMVDAVLYFEGDSNYRYRILRSVKNRFGPSGEIAVLGMSDRGLNEVTNASELFLHNTEQPQSGTAVTAVLEGSRVLAVELQALVNRTHFGLPQRVAAGINPKRLSLLVAVMERHSGIVLGDHDIFFNVAGGLSISEPAADCAVVAALLSSFRNKPLAARTAFIGEVGLGGEIRPVSQMTLRLRELSRMGFTHCIVPRAHKKDDWAKAVHGLQLVQCGRAGEIAEVCFG